MKREERTDFLLLLALRQPAAPPERLTRCCCAARRRRRGCVRAQPGGTEHRQVRNKHSTQQKPISSSGDIMQDDCGQGAHEPAASAPNALLPIAGQQ